jgi:hypothetical protein
MDREPGFFQDSQGGGFPKCFLLSLTKSVQLDDIGAMGEHLRHATTAKQVLRLEIRRHHCLEQRSSTPV